MIDRFKKILLSIRLFSSLVIIEKPLRWYQVEPVDAVIDSCLHNRGLEFLWIFPRQSGKDEAVAQMVVFLLTLFHRLEASIVHTYPIGQQLQVGVTRLDDRLENMWTERFCWSKSKPTRRGIRSAQCVFFSGHPLARAEGATANLLLVVNEVQDHNEATVERRFTPMRASTNATALYVGTVRTTSDYLWRTRQRLEKLEAEDGIRRVWVVGPDAVGRENPHYKAFVDGQIRLKGRNHPAIKTELFNEPVDVAAGLFPKRRRALMLGQHKRLHEPQENEIYLALVDVGGQDEAAISAFADLQNPSRDYTTCSIVRVVRDKSLVGPRYEVVDIWLDHGGRHFQEVPGRPSVFNRLLAYLDHWGVVAVISDFTGIGQGITDALIEKFNRVVFGFDFAKSYNKARLGNDFLAVVETGRFKYFRDGCDDEGSDAWWFFIQCEHCGYELSEGMPIERGLKWSVKASAKIVVNGKALPIHDDRLLSAALIAEADRLYRVGDLFLTTGESAVIPRKDDDVDKWS